ncbi:MAG: AzlD domain-containing protein [Gemmobacter sp.]
MTAGAGEVWAVILGVGVGTFLIRFSFLGLVGTRPLPAGIQRLLRYTAVAVIPGLVAPLVLWPAATGGTPDAARLIAAAVTLAAGMVTRRPLLSILCGAAALWLALTAGF